ncbi:hypothetical protein LSCM4_04822 [Leishmania orientalis]|uniref:Uncharacterized protein n=1 Tax=Leishmania orientalis TaxID=2249476 RepID=A0A836HW62_9TRYP|nr:hypothetical protein LSCM4_04822 [Leishmania orientalis]
MGSCRSLRERHHGHVAAEVNYRLVPSRPRRGRPATTEDAGPAAERRVTHREAVGAREAPGGEVVPAVPDGARAGAEERAGHAHRCRHGSLRYREGAAEAQRARRHRQKRGGTARTGCTHTWPVKDTPGMSCQAVLRTTAAPQG